MLGLRFIGGHSMTLGRSMPASSECYVPYLLEEQNVHLPRVSDPIRVSGESGETPCKTERLS